MNKVEMREYVAFLESEIDKRLNKWKKQSRIENGEAIQVNWQFEQTHFLLHIFWEDGKETIQLEYLNPRTNHRYTWHGLNPVTFNKVMDRIGNLAQVTMYPIANSE